MKPTLGPLLKRSPDGLFVASPSTVIQNQPGNRVSVSVPASAQFLAGGPDVLSIGFRYLLNTDEISATDSNYSSDLFDIISDSLGGYVGIVPYIDNPSDSIYTVLYGPPGIFAFANPATISGGQWITVSLVLSRRANGQIAAQLTTGDGNIASCLSAPLPAFTFNKLYAGAFISRISAHSRLLDDFTVVHQDAITWSADFFTGNAADYFDSTVGAGITTPAQDFDYAMKIDNAGTDAYGVKNFTIAI